MDKYATSKSWEHVVGPKIARAKVTIIGLVSNDTSESSTFVFLFWGTQHSFFVVTSPMYVYMYVYTP